MNRLLGCNEKIKRLTDWEPKYSFNQGIKETIEWIGSNLNRYKSDVYTI